MVIKSQNPALFILAYFAAIMLILFSVTAGLLLIYAVLIGYYELWWAEIPVVFPKDLPPVTGELKISVIIPARNEEQNIRKCLSSLQKQTYPPALLEIIVVNDHSTDNTALVVENFGGGNIRLLHLSDYINDPINSYKKKAIEIAIGVSSGELIITTDADCTAGEDWIASLARFYQQQDAVFIAAGVKISTNGSLLSLFQSLDFLTLQGITGASVHKQFHSMCNGANMAYAKSVFYEVGGFQGIDRIASGDDMLLMHKIFLKHPERVFFLKAVEATVTTQPEKTWQAFINQRIRWASKADKYDDKRI
ncbi:MAG: glycosyltransferase, partial [Chitinophagaceae bacterium]|nr:glycosyltransferase [Chitinophagaceae bacterium]